MKAASVTEPNCPGASDWLLPLSHTHFSTGWRHSAVISVFPVLGPTHTHTGAVESHSVGRPSASHTHVCDRTRWHALMFPSNPRRLVCVCWVGGAIATRAEVRNPYKGRCSRTEEKRRRDTGVAHRPHVADVLPEEQWSILGSTETAVCPWHTHIYMLSQPGVIALLGFSAVPVTRTRIQLRTHNREPPLVTHIDAPLWGWPQAQKWVSCTYFINGAPVPVLVLQFLLKG